MDLRPRLAPGLAAADYAQAYARDGVVQIDGLFPPEVADALADTLARRTVWSLVHADPQGGHAVLSPDAMARLGPDEIRARLEAAMRRAADGFAYLYLVYPMIDAYVDGRDPGHPLHAVTEFLNGPDFIAFAAAVTGETVVKVDAQATCYRPGHFLTLHDDRGVGERRAAYTLGLTQGWRPDWGGQLLFHDAARDVVHGFAPRFNTLTLFKVPLAHSVAPVAAYAARPRLTITGWLRDDPPYGPL
ncbi:MAG: proline hydroxylase [Phenylobacterium sp.]|uniref:2OG-Fe(II) oxygenase n=1 Tax=Phenylobacterium sp. TaxID=1871053 RepID=UPI0025FCF5A6|nr:2OG-Fe(II) oxygenase family protein [Phenylobacterium sp.]MBI1197063.1 proline hydroxylase [Phenylobacterium sp.]